MPTLFGSIKPRVIEAPSGDCLKIGGQAAFGTGADESLAGWNFCP